MWREAKESTCRAQREKSRALEDISGLREHRTRSTGKEARQDTHTGQQEEERRAGSPHSGALFKEVDGMFSHWLTAKMKDVHQKEE